MPYRRRKRPIRSAADAAWLIDAAVTRPLAPETLFIPLTAMGEGPTIARITGTTAPDSLLRILATILPSLTEHPDLLLATVRPLTGLVPGDVDRWLEASDLCERY